MNSRALRLILMATAAALAALALVELRGKRQTAHETADNIRAQLNSLDPVSRAAVVAELGLEEVHRARH